MTVSGINPATASMLAAQGGVAGQQSLVPSLQPYQTEQPGIGARLIGAVKAAFHELRGDGGTSNAMAAQQLAMQAALAPRAASIAPAPAPVPVRTAKKVVHAKTWKTLASTPRPTAAVQPGAAGMAGRTLPVNATALPGGVVYSYDGNGNPVATGGLAGLDPAMQQRLGLTPAMMQGIEGMTQDVDPAGPQLNQTNQLNLSGLGTGGVLGSAVPVLGQPILNPPTVVPAATTTTAPTEPGSAALEDGQVVHNANTNDSDTRGMGYGAGYGWGGIATPYSPYGASMTGAMLGTSPGGSGVGGFFSRLFGR